jgi:hypothetical protein
MRSWTKVSALALAWQLVGCTVDDENPNNGRRRKDDPATACDESSAALTASSVKRLERAYVEGALRELFSPLGDASRTQLLASLRGTLDLIPSDVAPTETGPASRLYASSDDRVDQDHVDAMFRLAVTVASEVADAAKPYAGEMLEVCGGANLDDDACLTTFVKYYGRKALRRPLVQAEVEDFKSFYKSAGGDGLFALVGRLIGHPAFYYRFDAEGDVVSGAAGTVYRLTRWELLSKVTFLFWSTPPTDELYDYTEATDVTDDQNLPKLLDRVLADPRATDGIAGFYREWLQLDKTQTPATDGNIAASKALVLNAGIPDLPPTHRDDMIREVLDLASHYSLATDGKLSDMLTSPYSFARTSALASIYGVTPWDGTKEHLVPLPEGQRSGLLTRAAMVASNTENTRPIIKGVRVLRRVLCTDIPPPPPTINITPVLHVTDKTTRQSVDEATADATCAGCHRTINGLGYLTENYDPIGRFRDKELRFEDQTATVASSLPIRTTTVNALGDGKEIADGVALSARIAESGKADVCLVRNYFSFANGRVGDDKADGCDLEHLQVALTGGSIKQMLRASVLLPSFRQRLVK